MDEILSKFKLKEGDSIENIKKKLHLLQLACEHVDKKEDTKAKSDSKLQPNVQKLLEENRRLRSENEKLKRMLSI
jgi:hypothetical protein